MNNIYVTIPVMNEPETLPETLNALAHQEYQDFSVVICVNQPEEWWYDPEKIACCEQNIKTIKYLKKYNKFPIFIIDRASKGKGWKSGNGGVGYARKTMMDEISRVVKDDDIIVSLDADTVFEEDYLYAVNRAFEIYEKHDAAISVPYFHKLTNDEKLNRAILRYEIYLRYYAINLWRISSPYCFTALGSAMAFTVYAYKKCGGMPPRISGEDFYMLQKLQKTCSLFHWCGSMVYPASRISERAVFGTGKALAKGLNNDWHSYPIYSYKLFDDIGKTIQLFPELFYSDIETPLSTFLRKQLRTDDLWDSLRANHSEESRFIRACHERLDGLRIFQYLRAGETDGVDNALSNLVECLQICYPDYIRTADLDVRYFINKNEQNNFDDIDIEQLDKIRRFLFLIEKDYRQNSILL